MKFSSVVFGLVRTAGTSLDRKRTPELAGVSEDCLTTLTFPHRMRVLETKLSPVLIPKMILTPVSFPWYVVQRPAVPYAFPTMFMNR